MADTSLDETQYVMEVDNMAEQQRLDEEEVEFGIADDREEEEQHGYGKLSCYLSLFTSRRQVTSCIH